MAETSVNASGGLDMGYVVICENCGHVDKPKVITKGSFSVELVLWILLIVPGIIYSFWRLLTRYKGCAKCQSKEILPIDTPRGIEFAEKYGMSTPKEN